MNPEKIKKWIRIIAGWSLFLAIASAALYLLIYFKIIDDELKLRDHIDFIAGTIAGFIIFIGLWKLTSWGEGFGVKSLFLTLALEFGRNPVNGAAAANSI